MNKIQTFQEFLTNQSVQVELSSFVINIVLVAILSYCLGLVYIRFGQSLSNRKQFSKNFIVLAMTTMLIITIVKSSLALSLGLVGALSIVRFRAAIKEPEELSYLFLNIAIGLGLGADQRVVTCIGFLIIVALIILINFQKSQIEDESKSMHLVINNSNAKEDELNAIVQTLEKYCEKIKLKRVDNSQEELEVSFLVDLSNFNSISTLKSEFKKINNNTQVTFFDNRDLV